MSTNSAATKPAAVAGPLQGMIGTLAQQAAVGQAGEAVVQRLVGEVALGPFALAHLTLPLTPQLGSASAARATAGGGRGHGRPPPASARSRGSRALGAGATTASRRARRAARHGHMRQPGPRGSETRPMPCSAASSKRRASPRRPCRRRRREPAVKQDHRPARTAATAQQEGAGPYEASLGGRGAAARRSGQQPSP